MVVDCEYPAKYTALYRLSSGGLQNRSRNSVKADRRADESCPNFALNLSLKLDDPFPNLVETSVIGTASLVFGTSVCANVGFSDTTHV